MATLSLTKTWLNLVATGAAISAWREHGADADAVAMDGAVATYAGGRQRSVTVEGVSGNMPFTLIAVPVADTLTLRSWYGETVLYRDNLGRKMYGVLFEDSRTPWKQSPGMYNVSMVLQLVDVDETV